MSLKNNMLLLSLILKKGKYPIKDFIEKYEFDFDHFSKFLRINRVDGFIYIFLEQNNLLEIIPPEIYERYKYHYEYQLNKNNILIQESKNLNDLIANNNIELIFLKGPFFTLRFYNDIGQREIADVDILIRRNGSIQKTDKILRNCGFSLRSIPLFGTGITTRVAHHYEYIKDGIKLDLHWVLQSHFSFNIDYEKIWSTKQKFLLNGINYYMLSDEYELVFRILSIFMDIQLGTIRIKSLIDLYMILNKIDKNFDWIEFFDLRRNEGLYLITLNVMDLVLGVLDCRESFYKLSKIIENESDSIVYGDDNQKLLIFESQRFAIRNKFWALKSYNAPMFKSLLWWVISLPVKLLVYKEASKKSAKKLFKR